MSFSQLSKRIVALKKCFLTNSRLFRNIVFFSVEYSFSGTNMRSVDISLRAKVHEAKSFGVILFSFKIFTSFGLLEI